MLFGFLVLRLISPYAISMKIASTATPSRYSGIAVVAVVVVVTGSPRIIVPDNPTAHPESTKTERR